MSPKSIIHEIATALTALTQSGNHWRGMWQERLEQLEGCLPHGSGFDNGTHIDGERSKPNRIVLTTSFHHMNQDGFYDGWTDHDVIVTPSLTNDFDLRITGRDRNDWKSYAYDVFSCVLAEDAPEVPWAPAREPEPTPPAPARPTVEKIEFVRGVDDIPDLTHLGRYTNGEDVLVGVHESYRVIDRLTYGDKRHATDPRYFIADNVSNHEEALQNYRRAESYNNGHWCMCRLFCRASIRITHPDDPRCTFAQTLTTPGLYGVESDSEDSHFWQVFAEEFDTMIAMFDALNVDHSSLPEKGANYDVLMSNYSITER